MRNEHNRREFRFLVLSAIFLAALIWFLPTSYFDLSREDCQKLQKLAEDEYFQEFQFDESWSFEDFTCNSHESAILNALQFLKTTQFQLPDEERDFDFYEWIKGRNPTFTKREILAFSGIARIEENRIEISTIKLDEADPVSIANILIHETRHLEEGFNSHVRCKKDPQKSCDVRLEEDPFDGGAYNYNVIYLHRLIEYGHVSRSERYSAEQLMALILENQFNHISPQSLAKYQVGL
ncbi:MAG: hypothetical protein AAGF54_08130 [Pseudomonadota bacterium]